ncbi:MAG: ABC transporter permease [Acidobacteria bacterium]|nr:ABC transporter permease [Acidobacteriota bacterium]
MAAQNIGIVYRKELTDMLRDRRTIVSSILLPILMFPLLMLGIGTLATMVVRKATRESPTVMLRGEEHAPELARLLRENKKLEIVPAAEDYVQRINDKKLRAAVEIPAGFEENIRTKPGEPQTLILYHYEGEFRSQNVLRHLQAAVGEYNERVVAARVASAKMPATVLTAFDTKKQNVASAEKVTGNVLGMMLPYFIIILCLTGAMYPAMDLTAGEKERGTIETILASPVRRTDLVLGKFLLVMTFSIVTTALSVLSFSGSVLVGAELLSRVTKDFVLAVSGKSAAVVFLMVVPLAATFSALLLAISLIARSYREAQSYLGPLIFLVILPGMASMLPGVELDTRLALVPILNVSLVAREIFAGQYHWNQIGLIFASTCVYAALALAVAVRQFNREEVLFRS